MRTWFVTKKEKMFGWMLETYAIALMVLWAFMREDFKVAASVATALLLLGWYYTKGNFKKRRTGLRVEDEASAWLRDACAGKGIRVSTGIKMRYGDIDIHIPIKKIVIDVKAFHVIDKRVHDLNLLRSIDRQIDHTGAAVAVIWLPRAPGGRVVKIEDDVFAITGKRAMIDFIESRP